MMNPVHFYTGLCVSQTLSCSGRKLVTLPNKSSCSLISYNSAEYNHNSCENEKSLGSPPQLTPDKYSCPGSFLKPRPWTPQEASCAGALSESPRQGTGLVSIASSELLMYSLFLQLLIRLLIFLLFKMNLRSFIYIFIAENRHDIKHHFNHFKCAVQ